MKKTNNPNQLDRPDKFPEVYLNIDHLKAGDYVFHFVEGKKIIKSIPIRKKE